MYDAVRIKFAVRPNKKIVVFPVTWLKNLMGRSVGFLFFFLSFFFTFLKISGGFGPLFKGAAGVLPSLAPVFGKLTEEPIKIELEVLALGRSAYRKHNFLFYLA